MTRLLYLDNFRGIAFILMIIHHIFYFYDVSNNYSTSYASNMFIDNSGLIARSIFIFLAGISLSFITNKKQDDIKNSNKKQDDFKISLKKRLKRSLEIMMHAAIISLITYIFHPNLFVRFGILHFIALTTFLLSFIAPYPKLALLLFVFSIFYTPPKINPFVDTITGASLHFNMMDWFPLKPWISIMLSGLIIGHNTNLTVFAPYFSANNIITRIGQNSLELYTAHVLLLILVYSLKK
tara:strand:+ start:280 stop:993 length:714 start_codon:yes stop_codon:yes gene_type:complete